MKRTLILLFLYGLTSYASSDERIVYICDSPYATSYHYSKSCRAIGKCTHEIKKVTLTDAVNTYRRSLCGYEK
jgi:hypothetical protein